MLSSVHLFAGVCMCVFSVTCDLGVASATSFLMFLFICSFEHMFDQREKNHHLVSYTGVFVILFVVFEHALSVVLSLCTLTQYGNSYYDFCHYNHL